MSPRPILLLSAGRAGSNLLKSFFRPNKSILDVGEFLRPGEEPNVVRYGFWQAENGAWARRLMASRPDPKAPGEIFRDYAAWLRREAGDQTAFVDMKYNNVGPVDTLWRDADQPPPPLVGFLAEEAAVIHLVRRNPLAQLCSLRLALMTKVWIRSRHTGQTEPGAELQQVELNPASLVDRLRRLQIGDTIGAFWIASAKRKLTISYEDMLAGDRLAAPLQEALSALVDHKVDLSHPAGTQKIAPPLRDVIANVDDVRSALAGTEFAWCLDESPRPDGGGLRPPTPAHSARMRLAPEPGVRRSPLRGGPGRTGQIVLLGRELPAEIWDIALLTAAATRLAGAGLRPVLAVPDILAADRLIPGQQRILQAPQWPALGAEAPAGDALDHLEFLASIGLGEARHLAAMAGSWRSLVAALRPAAIIANDSPALVAAMGGGPIPVIAFGDAIALPPITPVGFPRLATLRSPPPPLGRMLNAFRRIGRRSETNDAAGLARLFATDARIIVDIPERDPYHLVRDEALALPPLCAGAPVPFPPTRRLLAILPEAFQTRRSLLEALDALSVPVETLSHPLDQVTFRAILSRTSHVICSAEDPCVTAALAGGRPLLLLRGGAKAELLGRCIEQQRLARLMGARRSAAEIRHSIDAFLADVGLQERSALTANVIQAHSRPIALDLLLDMTADAISSRPAMVSLA